MLGDRKADRVADDLLRSIVAGDLRVGELLPKEAELAERYGVNRSVIREAIKLLEVHRLVRPIRRRGTEILDPMRSLSPEVLRAMIAPRSGAVDREVLGDFLEIRAALDVEMSVMVAARRTDEDLARFDAHLEGLGRALHDRQGYSDRTDALTRDFARATQNRVFEMLVWWNQEVASELSDVFRTVRPANEPHLQGLHMLIDLVRRQDEAQVRTLVTAFHEWASPRLMAAAALASGAPLDSLMETRR